LFDFIDKFNIALGWYNPLTYLLFKKGVELREYECDGIVTENYSPVEYGKILVKEAESISRSGKWALSSAFITHSLFKRRLLMLFERQIHKSKKAVLVFAAAAVLGSGILLTVFSAPSSQPAASTQTMTGEKDALAGRAPEAIMQIVTGEVASLRDIYNGYLEKSPGLKGKIDLQFTIEGSGQVSKVVAKSSTTGVPQFDAQICQQASTWNFGKNEAGGIATFTYPFAFSK